ncbi:kinase-like domain-containing protein [Mycena polygramma]|nr:kinase-like domain-containing protein [Mycena polygramma]
MSFRCAGAPSPLPDLSGTFVDEGYMQLLELVHSDESSQVYKAFDTTSLPEDPIYYAVKCMRNDAPGSKRAAALRHECSMHKTVSNQPGVVGFHYTFTDGEDDKFVFMLLDPATDSLLDAIFKRGLYIDRPALIREAFLQLAEAVGDCHDRGVFHRDIRPRNIWCNASGTGIRLANFGAATTDKDSTAFECGSKPFMSPECADTTRASYSPRESDLWALAMVLFLLITRTTPWDTASPSDPRYAAFRADPSNYLAEAYRLSPITNDFFGACFAADPAKRLNLDEMFAAVRDIGRFALADTRVIHTSAAAARPARPDTAPDFRFVDHGKKSITARQRFLNKQRRRY